MTYYGIEIYSSNFATKRERLFKKSRHRSRRIRKKLLKRFGGEFKDVPIFIFMNNRAYCHPVIYERLLREKMTNSAVGWP